MIYSSIGTLHYEPTKLIVQVDQELSDYYRKLIPKYIENRPQLYPAHISVVRKEIPVNKQFWGKYEGQDVEFFYEPFIHSGKFYFWLNVFCVKLEEIRLELGLPVDSPFTRPPDSFLKVFHITLANSKGK